MDGFEVFAVSLGFPDDQGLIIRARYEIGVLIRVFFREESQSLDSVLVAAEQLANSPGRIQLERTC